MKKLLIFSFLLAFSISAFADVRPPLPKPTPKPTADSKEKEANMHIAVTREVTEPTLVIKKSSAKMLRAALDEIEAEEDNTASIEGTIKGSSAQTIIGGLFLSLAFLFGGVWFFRSKPSKINAALMLIAALGITTTFVFANIAPPKLFSLSKSMLSPELQGYGKAQGKVKIKIREIAPADIQLLIPANDGESDGGEE
jgi:hypothetical protein